MSRYYFKAYKHHKELFNDDIPRLDIEIKEAIYGYDATELWTRDQEKKWEDVEKYLTYVRPEELDGRADSDIAEGLFKPLLKSIQQHGILTPLLIMTPCRIPECNYYVLEGHHRAACAYKLGLESIPSLILELDKQYTKKMLGGNK